MFDEQAAKDDEDFNSQYSSLSKDSFNATLSSIDEDIRPIKFQLRTPIESASSSTVQKLKRKLSQCITASTEYICDALVPGQADELMKLLLSEDNQKSDKVIPTELFSLVESYKSAPSQTTSSLLDFIIGTKYVFKDRMYRILWLFKVHDRTCPQDEI